MIAEQYFSGQRNQIASGDGVVLGEAREWLIIHGIDEDLAEKLSRLGGLDAIAAASESQLIDEGLPKIKARRILELFRLRSPHAKVSHRLLWPMRAYLHIKD